MKNAATMNGRLIMKNAAMITVAISFAGFIGNAEANLLINGNFEEPALQTNTSMITTPTSWQQGESQPSLINGVFANYPMPINGQQYIGMGVEGNGSRNGITQSFTISDAATYLLSWYDATPIGFGTTSPYSIAVLDSLSQIVFSNDFDAYSGILDWIYHSESMVLNPGTYTLSLSAEPPIGHVGSLLDNVSLKKLSSVPSPGTFVLLLTGIFCLVGVRIKNITVRLASNFTN